MVMGANRREASSRETSLGFEWNRVNIMAMFKLLEYCQAYDRSSRTTNLYYLSLTCPDCLCLHLMTTP